MVLLQVLSMGSVLGAIHILVLPSHTPASAASFVCCSPGVPAAWQAAMQEFHSASVQPGGGGGICISG